jgi:DNA-binding HxlR family transcriptional regulator
VIASSPVEVFPTACEGQEIFRLLTGRWGMVILLSLGDGPLRYFELRDRIAGISDKMLAQTLRLLARDGLVRRDVADTVPPQVTYSLTTLGERFRQPLESLRAVIAATLGEVRAERRNFDDRRG